MHRPEFLHETSLFIDVLSAEKLVKQHSESPNLDLGTNVDAEFSGS